jgi:protein-S-isoprenylcysteine O-methyltransferase Ste14
MAVLPFMVAGMIPYWIAERCGVALEPAGSVGFQGAGLALLGSGLLLVFSTVWGFATEGRGTLAPWDPPRVLVVRGPYRFVRNRSLNHSHISQATLEGG